MLLLQLIRLVVLGRRLLHPLPLVLFKPGVDFLRVLSRGQRGLQHDVVGPHGLAVGVLRTGAVGVSVAIAASENKFKVY